MGMGFISDFTSRFTSLDVFDFILHLLHCSFEGAEPDHKDFHFIFLLVFNLLYFMFDLPVDLRSDPRVGSWVRCPD